MHVFSGFEEVMRYMCLFTVSCHAKALLKAPCDFHREHSWCDLVVIIADTMNQQQKLFLFFRTIQQHNSYVE